MTLHLPPASEPPEDRTRGTTDRCHKCPHDWHGLTCRYATCLCQTSITGSSDE